MSRDRSAQPYKAGVKHGTNSGYTEGCRCDRCRMAMSDYQRLRRQGGSRPTPDPVPLAPLMQRLSSYVGRVADEISVEEIADACGVDRRTVLRWRACGRVAVRDIDEIAVRLGWHPAAIWGADWYITTTYYDEAVA